VDVGGGGEVGCGGVVIQIEVRAGFILWDAGGEQPPCPCGEQKDCEKQTDFWGAEIVGVQGADGPGEGDLAGHGGS
jgi:hypothetical protein